MRTWPSVKYVEGENPWVTYFKRQTLHKNNCINSVVTGMPGLGKSWGLIYLLSKADPTFTSERIFFRASKMLKWIDEGNLKPGVAFMFDEAGIDASSLSWWDEINKALNAFFQTGRSDNYIFGMTVPFMSNVSKGVRCLMNVRFQAEGWTNKNLTLLRGYHMEYNGDLDKIYRKRLLVNYEGGATYVEQIQLPKANGGIIDEYERMKKEFKSNLYKNIGIKVKKQEDKALGKPQELTEEEAMVLKCANEGLSDAEGAKICGSTVDMYRLRKMRCKKKNYVINTPKMKEKEDKKTNFLKKMGRIDVLDSLNGINEI